VDQKTRKARFYIIIAFVPDMKTSKDVGNRSRNLLDSSDIYLFILNHLSVHPFCMISGAVLAGITQIVLKNV